MEKNNKKLGDDAEWFALSFFLQKKYTLLAQNFRVGRAEIDLIFSFNNTIIFAEVKYRKNDHFGFPEEFVSDKQKELIRAAAEIFLEINELEKNPLRFDILALTSENGKFTATHFEDAF